MPRVKDTEPDVVSVAESAPEIRTAVAIDAANRACRGLAPDHAYHGIEFVEELTDDSIKARCMCGATLAWNGAQLARVWRQ